jgi:DNA-directed RNA polymerase specialized sigma24 family protein
MWWRTPIYEPIAIDTFREGNFRVWLLTIVRNGFVTRVKENRSGRMTFVPDTSVADSADKEETLSGSRPRNPEPLLLERIDSQTLGRLVEQLPAEYHEVLHTRKPRKAPECRSAR